MFDQEEIQLEKELDLLTTTLDETLGLYGKILNHHNSFKNESMSETDRHFIVKDINNNGFSDFEISEQDISLENYGGGYGDAAEATAKDLYAIAKKVGKAILRILDKTLDVARRFFNKRLGMIAIREREAKRAFDEVNRTMPDLEDTARRIQPTQVASLLFDKDTGNLTTPAEMSALSKSLKDGLSPKLIQRRAYDATINLMDLTRKTPLNQKDLLDVHDDFWNSVVLAYGLKVRENRDGKVATKRIANFPMVFTLTTDDDTSRAPTAKLEATDIPSLGEVEGLTPSEAIIALTTAIQILGVAKDVNDSVDIERRFKGVMTRIKKEMENPAPNTEMIMNIIPKWNSLAVQASKAMSNYQYRIALGIMSYVGSSHKTWSVR